jgi:hypothetical protein
MAKEMDRALYYYNLALAKGYDAAQVLQRAQRLKDAGVQPKPPISVGKARHAIHLRQEPWCQFVFVKANYPDRLVASLNKIITCTIDPKLYKVETSDGEIKYLETGKPAMIFQKKDAKNLRVTYQYFTEMEKYTKTETVDGKKINIPAKRKKYDFFIVYDTFTDIVVQLKRITLLFAETYYEDHRNEIVTMINGEYQNYKQPEMRYLAIDFLNWLESFSVLNALARDVPSALESDSEYLKEEIMATMDYYLKLVEKDPIYKADFVFFLLVFLEKIYARFPAELPDKYAFIYQKYLPCRKFDEAYSESFLSAIADEIITEPKLREFTKSLKNFRQTLFKK